MAVGLSAVPTFAAPWSPRSLPAHGAGKYWHGWKGVQKYFVFGDSYTTTGFNITMAQPSSSVPLGNPAYPGYTSSNGPNYVDYLTTQYNQSLVETYNLAYGGATVDSDLVAQYLPTVLDFRQQVNTEFFPYYVDKPAAKWTSSNSLFSAFFGINDVGNSYSAQNATLNTAIFKVYASLIDELYHAGARNFLFLNVPPVNLSPGTSEQGAAAQALEAADIADFNDRLAQMAYNLQYTYVDTTVFQFDTSRVFNQVLTNPASYPQTAGYKNTTDYCVAYENGTPAMNTFNTTCGVPVNEYFWLNTLHPTYPMQNVIAQQIALQLESGSFVS
ncbi:MAG: hypothetical protein MMC33_010594 [Icmadophila ericetorum]|nr:hypothetical protein [Icmadophila ericetorum]